MIPAPGTLDTEFKAREGRFLCPECDYNLFGSSGERCPWCGASVDWAALSQEGATASAWPRAGVAVACLTLSVGCLVALTPLLSGASDRLTVSDGLAVLSVLMAAAGHLALAVLVLMAGRRWPLRSSEASRILFFIGCLAVLAALGGAIRFLFPVDRPRMIRGVTVTNVFEFLLVAALFMLPAWCLLVLRFVSFRAAVIGGVARPREAYGRGPLLQAPFLVEVLGRFQPSQLFLSVSSRTRQTTPSLERVIEQTWESERALADSSRRALYNGTLVRLAAAQVDTGCLHLELGSTTYREFLGTHGTHTNAGLKSGAESLAQALGVSALVVTSDGFLTLGRRSARVTLHAGALHTFGGMLEPADRRNDGTCDPFGAMVRELAEELGLVQAEVTDLVIAGLVRDRRLHQPELLFEALTSLSRRELSERFAALTDPDEHSAVEFVADEAQATLSFLESATPLTPVAEAALLLRGRHRFGTGWYEKTCLIRYGQLPPQSET